MIRSVMWLSISLLLAAVGVFLVRPESFPDEQVTNGTVVGIETRETDPSLGAPVIQYSVDGQSLRFTDNVYSNRRPSLGEVVEVAYDPSDPSNARWTGSSSRWMWLTFTGAGALLAVFVLPSLFRAARSTIGSAALVLGQFKGS